MRFPIRFDVLPELEILMRLPIKSPELVFSKLFIEIRSKQELKNIFLNNYDAKKLKNIDAHTETRY